MRYFKIFDAGNNTADPSLRMFQLTELSNVIRLADHRVYSHVEKTGIKNADFHRHGTILEVEDEFVADFDKAFKLGELK